MAVVSKIDAAQRQLEAAIRLVAFEEDPIAALCLAASGGQIVRDLCKARGIDRIKEADAWIRPEKLKEYWKGFNSAWAFIKHANRGPDEVSLDVEWVALTDLLLAIHIDLFGKLTGDISGPMKAFWAFLRVSYPDLFVNPANETPVSLAGLAAIAAEPRSERLELLRFTLSGKAGPISPGIHRSLLI